MEGGQRQKQIFRERHFLKLSILLTVYMSTLFFSCTKKYNFYLSFSGGSGNSYVSVNTDCRICHIISFHNIQQKSNQLCFDLQHILKKSQEVGFFVVSNISFLPKWSVA